jgi:hypothetical protein
MAEALRKAIEIFAAAPQSPTSAAPVVPGHDQRENLIRSAKRFEESVARWRADMLIVQQGLATCTRTFPRCQTASQSAITSLSWTNSLSTLTMN